MTESEFETKRVKGDYVLLRESKGTQNSVNMYALAFSQTKVSVADANSFLERIGDTHPAENSTVLHVFAEQTGAATGDGGLHDQRVVE